MLLFNGHSLISGGVNHPLLEMIMADDPTRATAGISYVKELRNAKLNVNQWSFKAIIIKIIS